METVVRNPSGLSMTELLVSTIMMGFCFAVIGELVVLNTLAATKLSNKTDSLTETRFAIERIKSDIRLGKTFVQPDPAKAHTTLIILQPVFYEDKTNTNNPLNGFPVEVNGVEILNRVTYELIEDPTKPGSGEYLLQLSRTVEPGSEWPATDENYQIRSPISSTTILKGIVGPKTISDPTKVKTFQYIESMWEKPPSTDGFYSASQSKTSPPVVTSMTSGATIDLEVKRGTTNKYATTFGAHAESFLKYNRHAQVTNK